MCQAEHECGHEGEVAAERERVADEYVGQRLIREPFVVINRAVPILVELRHREQEPDLLRPAAAHYIRVPATTHATERPRLDDDADIDQRAVKHRLEQRKARRFRLREWHQPVACLLGGLGDECTRRGCVCLPLHHLLRARCAA
eukprot:3553604-Prymnesium_polylepis.1